MTRKRSILVLLSLGAALVIACRRGENPPPDEHDAAAAADHGASPQSEAGQGEEGHDRGAEVRVPLAGLRGLAFTRAGDPQQEGVWAPAEAVSDSGGVAIVSAPAAGIVRRLLVRPGETVRAGQAVAELASAEIADLAARYRTDRKSVV